MSTIEDVIRSQKSKMLFYSKKLSYFLYGPKQYEQMIRTFQKLPSFPYDFNLMNHGRTQWLKYSYALADTVLNRIESLDAITLLYLMLSSYQQPPYTLHLGMFMKCIEIMGTQTQLEQYMPKCRNFSIIGCYAQTQIGHGSDVQSLQTTATYLQGRDQFVVHTPSISAAKYWPGDLGISSNYALVFARLIVKEKDYGVQPFVMQIRDENHKLLPGIEAGDIGPKIGFHTKDNGYLIFKNVIIPKRNMLRKFISVSKQGQIKKKGDPTISYATMMTIRQHISCLFPKIYGQAITIATRYSFFRKQFKNSKGEQLKIIDYQTQQDKIVPRIAEYYAIIVAGNKIRSICEQNFRLVKQKENFSLMNETHACLCMSKAFFTQTVYHGMEICRRSCGGHGFSNYSGFPSIIQQYTANMTHQGQNTILHLQTARFLMKSYKYYLTKKKPLGDTVKYIDSFDFLMGKQCEIDSNDPLKWTLESMRVLLAQAVCYLISSVTQKVMGKEQNVTETQVINQNAGIRLQQLARTHASYFTFNEFRLAIIQQKDQSMKQTLIYLCALYGINSIIRCSVPLIQGNFITNNQISSLLSGKEIIYKKLRPHIFALVDGIGLPEKYIRSALINGNPYQNFYQLAKENPLNKGVTESAIIIKDGIQQAIKPKL